MRLCDSSQDENAGRATKKSHDDTVFFAVDNDRLSIRARMSMCNIPRRASKTGHPQRRPRHRFSACRQLIARINVLFSLNFHILRSRTHLKFHGIYRQF
ncbi:hypothetical protein [Rhizobium halophytocola]|uniref:hypothetical protein n=1 Tax=Rhizobium halophytocola TaxID=735519 RepID=UPI001AEADCD9|nr:hypothetical protein [Rhizobium halophytocola]